MNRTIELSLKWGFSTILISYLLLTAYKAALASVYNGDFPEPLALKLELLPVIFPIHMISGALSLLLVPAAFALRHHRRLHIPVARSAAAIVIISGITALPVAWVSPVTIFAAAGFIAQACTWMTFLGLGIWHIRGGRTARHRVSMLLMTATTSGAIFFRINLGLWAAFAQGQYYYIFYSCNAWFAWITPLFITAYVLKREKR